MNSDDEIMKADGFDDAIIGQCDSTGRLIYSKDKIIETLCRRDGMDPFEAAEFYTFNILMAYVGEGTPIYMGEYNEDIE